MLKSGKSRQPNKSPIYIMKLSIRISLLSLTVFIFSFCQKTTPVDEIEQEILSERQSCINPFDFVGALHNKSLDYVIANKTSWAPTTTPYNISQVRNNMCNQVKAFVRAKVMLQNPGVNTVTLNVKLTDIISLTQQNYSPSSGAPDFSSENLVPQLEDQKILQENLQLLYGYLSKSSDLDDLHKQISEFDNYICAISCPDSIKEVCFIASAVLKHSTTYWVGYEASSTNPWLPFAENQTQSRAFNWKKIGAIDALGAVRGAIGGFKAGLATTGLVMGPGGAILSAAGGALTWGAGASALEAFDQWWD